jgi:putative DNA primase/helicase
MNANVPTIPGDESKKSRPPRSTVLLTRAADIKIERIYWAWLFWLARGKLTLLAGLAGVGKTTLALALASIVSRCGKWPDGSNCDAGGNVIIWSGEDSHADTLAPRLLAAGADMQKVHFLSGRLNEKDEIQPFDPAFDLPLLSQRLDEIGGAAMLIIDPLMSAIKGDAHRANDVRRDLQAVVDLAAQHNCAVVGITHFSKGSKGVTPAERVIGSQAFGALARMVLVVGQDETTGRHVLARAKSNIAPARDGVSFRLEMVDIEGIQVSYVVWGGLVTGSAHELLADMEPECESDEKSERDDAARFLGDLLADGPLPVNVIRSNAAGAGYAWRTIERAKRELGIEARKNGMKEGWSWALPD